MECKDIKAIIEHCKEKDLNRTRLECKVHVGGFCLPLLTIWIEPDWNVKDCTSAVASITMLIWIEPDWNVKQIEFILDKVNEQIWIEPDWNVKVYRQLQVRLWFWIWIEPDWNVKPLVF